MLASLAARSRSWRRNILPDYDTSGTVWAEPKDNIPTHRILGNVCREAHTTEPFDFGCPFIHMVQNFLGRYPSSWLPHDVSKRPLFFVTVSALGRDKNEPL